MRERAPLTVTIITLNEEKNLPKALDSVAWADEIVVVDSGSTDRTAEIAQKAGARFMIHPWAGYGQQKNYAQSLATYRWVLNIDADEIVTPALRSEIEHVLRQEQQGKNPARGYLIPRKTWYLGRWILHGGWYPNAMIRLADKQYAQWTEPELHEQLKVQGPVGKLSAPLLHFTFESIQDQVETNLRFARLGALQLQRKGQRGNLLKLLLKPLGKFIETYIIKRGFLDGIAGFIISINAAHSMFLKYSYLIEKDINSRDNANTKP